MSNTSINNNSDNKLSHPECRRGEQVCCSVCSVRAGTRRNWWKRRCKGTYMPGCRACPLARPISQGFLRRAHQNSEKYREQTEGTRTGYFTSGRCVLLCLQRSHRDSRKLAQTAVQRHAHAWVPVLVPRPFSRSTNLPADSQMRFISNVAVVPSCANASGLYDGVLKGVLPGVLVDAAFTTVAANWQELSLKQQQGLQSLSLTPQQIFAASYKPPLATLLPDRLCIDVATGGGL